MKVGCLNVSVYVYEVQCGEVLGKQRAGRERVMGYKSRVYFCEQAGVMLSLGYMQKLWIKVKCR